MTTQKDRIEAAIRHIQTAADVDPWAMELAVGALKAQMDKPMKLSTVCLLCKKPAVTFSTDDDIPYTNYSYCEDCLRKGLKLLKAQPNLQPTCNQLATDTISRQAAIDAVFESAVGRQMLRGHRDLIEILKHLPSAQPEIIRCKDCRFWQDQEEGIVEVPICARPQNKHDNHPRVMIMGADDFCSRAERRDE